MFLVNKTKKATLGLLSMVRYVDILWLALDAFVSLSFAHHMPYGVKAGCVHLCWAAGNTVWSHMASDTPLLCHGILPLTALQYLYPFYPLLYVIMNINLTLFDILIVHQVDKELSPTWWSDIVAIHIVLSERIVVAVILVVIAAVGAATAVVVILTALTLVV